MPKQQHKKRHHHEMATATSTMTTEKKAATTSQPYYNNNDMSTVVVHLADEGEDSIDDILAEMAGQQGISLSPAVPSSSLASSNLPIKTTMTTSTLQQQPPLRDDTVNNNSTAATEETTTTKLFSTTIPSRPYSKQQLERVRLWNSTMNTWQRTGTFSNVTSSSSDGIFLPSFDVEMTRHFKIQSISSFLLNACKGLKMPAFERWLIDSKIEEGTHTYSSFTKFDPVLSGNVTAQYESSQRLMDEICEASNKKANVVMSKATSSTTTTATKETNKKAAKVSSSTTIILKRNDAKKIVQDLCHRTNTAVLEISQQQQQFVAQTSGGSNNNIHTVPIKKGDRIVLEGHPPIYTLVYHRDKKWQKPYCIKINATHYNKLYTMFVHVHCHGGSNNLEMKPTNSSSNFSNTGRGTMTTHVFHYLVMILLLRYSSLSGGQLLLDLRGGGMQGAIHDAVFDTMYHTLFPDDAIFMECFGSPLNSYLIKGYYSAFAIDIDWHFGSHGNFFHELICEGCCEVNPPFAPGIMSAMADRIEYNIKVANEKNGIVTFIVIVPHGGNEQDVFRAVAKQYGNVALQQMMNSEYCTYHFILPAKEHGYIEGAQHLRPTRYKESLYDTSVVVLQSTMAREQRRIDPTTFEEKIRQAFVSRHRDEVESRKER